MVKEIVKDVIFLGRKSAEASAEDVQIGEDLLDTLRANSHRCVGLAANMIGVLKRVIAVNDGGKFVVMFNPKILKSSKVFQTQEGCLSLDGVRETKRYENIKVEYFNEKFQKRIKTFSGFTAQIIQHEIDHCDGIII